MSRRVLLAIETSSAVGSIALEVDGQVAERTIATPREQTERVLGLIDELLAAAGIALTALDAIVFGRGPGSFTGLRVAAAVAQGLGFAAGTPLVPVSSLAALAQRGFDTAHPARGREAPLEALCLVDARMGELYSACFRLRGGTPEIQSAERIGPPELVEVPARPFFVIGDGSDAFAASLAGVLDAASARLGALPPRAVDLLPLALKALEAGQCVEPEAALPVYLRESDAWRRAEPPR